MTPCTTLSSESGCGLPLGDGPPQVVPGQPQLAGDAHLRHLHHGAEDDHGDHPAPLRIVARVELGLGGRAARLEVAQGVADPLLGQRLPDLGLDQVGEVALLGERRVAADLDRGDERARRSSAGCGATSGEPARRLVSGGGVLGGERRARRRARASQGRDPAIVKAGLLDPSEAPLPLGVDGVGAVAHLGEHQGDVLADLPLDLDDVLLAGGGQGRVGDEDVLATAACRP